MVTAQKGLIAALILAIATSVANGQNANPNVQVFIVAIGQFDASVYTSLNSAGTKANEIADFFRTTYKLREKQIHLYSDRTHNADEQTLLNLQKEMVRVAEDDESIVFLFVLSHGKVLTSTEYGLDLLVVATDTPGDVNKPSSERVLGSGFFHSFVRIGERSVVFAFFDTCSSGALERIGSYFRSTYELAHKRVVSIASSGANADSYDFAFTSQLLAHWKSSTAKSTLDCEFAANLPAKIPLTNQVLTVVLEDKSICMDSINASQAILFLIAEDAAPATIQLLDSKGVNAVPPRAIENSNSLPIFQIVDRAPIHADLYDSQTHGLIFHYPTIDFSTTPISFLDLRTKFRSAYGAQLRPTGITYRMQSGVAPSAATP